MNEDNIYRILNIMDRHSVRFETAAIKVSTNIFLWLFVLLVICVVVCNWYGYTLIKKDCATKKKCIKCGHTDDDTVSSDNTTSCDTDIYDDIKYNLVTKCKKQLNKNNKNNNNKMPNKKKNKTGHNGTNKICSPYY